jgi:Fungal Zn(2)-Cys(6) binuclear cluster domain/Zinc finger, C2H2 type
MPNASRDQGDALQDQPDAVDYGGEKHHKPELDGTSSTPARPDRDKKGQAIDAQDHGFYQCGTCKKTYNRADHLIRHVRSHTHEKPYVCDICGKGFARPDLLKRHASGHEDDEKNAADSSTAKKRKITTNPNPILVNRVTSACKACASSKLKCSEGKPCDRCIKKQLVCEDSSSSEDVSRSAVSQGQGNGCHPQDGNFRGPSNAEQDVLQPTQAESDAADSIPGTQPAVPRLELVVTDGVMELNGSYFPEFLRNVVAESGSSESTPGFDPLANFNQSFFPQNYIDLGTEDGDYSWSSDLWYSDGLQDAFKLPFESTFTPYAATMSNSSENSSSAGVGVDAFKRSLIGSWTPHAEDSGMMERQNLIAPKNVDTMPVFTESKKILPEPLSLNARDRILGMVLETCPQSAASRVIASFPSAEFLTDCIQYYFCRRHEEQIDSYIHLPTFRPNTERAELLAMLAAAGAVCTASNVVRKLGYALQEAVRHAIGRRVSRSPSSSVGPD